MLYVHTMQYMSTDNQGMFPCNLASRGIIVMTEETEETKLHFTRVRSKGDSSFYDPQSDIRVILPTVAKMTLDVLMQVNTDDWLKKEFSYLAKCYAIYQIRLAEDSTNMVQQVVEFENAVQKASPRAKMLWIRV